jgi:phage gp29-like protein
MPVTPQMIATVRARALLGGPVDRASLEGEQAGPTTSLVRNPYPSSPAEGLTPAALAQILRSSIDGFPERYLALAEDMEERFNHYGSVLATRKRQVAALPVTVVAAGATDADEAEAAMVREVVEAAPFRLAKIDMLDAIGKSFSASEIIWDTSSPVWKPKAFKRRDPRFFEFDRVDPEHLRLLVDGGREELKTAGWIVHRAKAKSGITIRGGLARQVAWLFLFQSFNLKDWAAFCEAYGHPLRVGKFDPAASPADKAILLDAVASIGVDFAAIIPTAMQIEFIKADITGSTDLFEKRANWIDQQVSKVVLGQTGTTDVIKGGGYASSKVHDEVRDDIKDADAEQLAATLNEQLVPALIAFNFGKRTNRTGLPQIVIGRPEEEDVGALVDNVAKLVPLGLRVGVAEMQRKVGVTPPKDGEELLVAPSSPLPATDELPPIGKPKPTKTAAAALQVAGEPDAIELAIQDVLGGSGWEALVTPLGADLQARIQAASDAGEVKAILAASFADLDVAALTDMLANAMFAARLAGELGEDLG